MSIKVIRYRLPSCWACPLINDDYTGLTDEECEEIHKIQDMETRTYEGVQHGDWVRCVLCGAQMLLPCGADKCPECSSEGTLTWVDEDKQEMDAKHLDCLVPIRKLELQEYLSPEILKMEHI